MSGTNRLVQSMNVGKSEETLAKALKNANEVVIKATPKKKKAK